MHDASICGHVSIAGPIVSLGSDLCVPVWVRLPPESPCQNSEVIILRTSSSTAARQDETTGVEDGGETQRRAENKALK